MLKNYNKLTTRYLKKNKRRSAFTVIGIVLSMILITLLSTFLPTAKKAILNEARKYNGDWHLSYGEVTEDFQNKIEANIKVENSLLVNYLEQINIKNGTMTLVDYEGELKDFQLVNLKEGKFPENNQEVVLEEWVLARLENKASLGDTINFNDRKLKIVGILYGDSSETETLIYSKAKNIEKGSLYVKVKEDKNIEANVEELIALQSHDNVEINYALTSALYDSGDSTNYSYIQNTVMIITLVIVIATMSIIYNSFNISVAQRTKELGILRILGSTPKQIRKLVRKEALILSLISIPVGTVLGLGILKLLVIIYNAISMGSRGLIGASEVEMIVSYKALIISLIIGFLTIYISAILPSRKAGKVSPLDALSNRTFINKDNIKRRKYKFLSKFFKIDKVMAYKNIKRNKGRYRITVFSISISLIIAITMYTFLVIGTDMIPIKENESRNIDVMTYIDSENKEDFNIVLEAVKEIEGVEKVYKGINTPKYEILFNEEKLNKVLVDNKISKYNGYLIDRSYKGESYVSLRSDFAVCDRDKMDIVKKYIKEGKVDFKDIEKNNKIIVIENTYHADKHYSKDIKAVSLKPGEKIKVNLQGGVEESNFRLTHDGMENFSEFSGGSNGGDAEEEIRLNNVIELEVAAVLKDTPFDMELIDKVGVIIAPKTAEYIADEYEKRNDIVDIEVRNDTLEVILAEEQNVKEVVLKIEDILMKKGIVGNVVNLEVRNANESNMVLQVKILIYGFILVVSILSTVNIINTVNTNISLRKKEFINLISIGMPMKKIRNMILLEGAFYGITSSFFGGTIGIIISYNMVRVQQNIVKLMSESIVGAIISIIIVIIVSIVTTIPGIRRISELNIIEELRKE